MRFRQDKSRVLRTTPANVFSPSRNRRQDRVRVGIDAHSIGRHIGGNESYVQGLLEGLEQIETNHEYFVYTTGAKPSFRDGRLRAKGIWPHFPLVRVPLSFTLMSVKDRLDAAHFQYIAPPWMSCPVVLSVHDLAFEAVPQAFSPLDRARLRLLVPFSARRAARVITCSEFSRRDLLKRYAIDAERVKVIYLGVEERFKPVHSKEQILAVREGYGVRAPFLISVGTLHGKKNLGFLARVFGEVVKEQGLPHHLLLCGKHGAAATSFLTEVKRLGIEDRVHCPGYVPRKDLPALLSAAEVFVFPSHYEGFGLAVLEAMACGTPVLSSDAGSLPEIVGDAGLMAARGDQSVWRERLAMLLRNSALRERLRRSGLERAGFFRWSETARQTALVYEQAIEESRRVHF